MDEDLRNAIAENLLMIKGHRLYFGERANQFSDPLPRGRRPEASAGDDILAALRDEAAAAVGKLTAEQIAAFAETF